MLLRSLLMILVVFATNELFAEGSRELAPNQTININGNLTNDIAALHINSPNYNFFASYSNPDPNNRLYINIQDPSSECIYLGFSVGHQNFTGQSPPLVDFEWRLVDPNGNVVYGPVIVTPANADIDNWSEAVNGPSQIYGAAGYNAVQITPGDLMAQGFTGAGDYYIQFNDRSVPDGAFLIDYWDITVADCSGATPIDKPGRIWSYNWAFFAINDFGFPERPFNGAFFVCAPDPADPDAAYITKIDFNGSGFRPAAFNIAFNSFGSQNTGDIAADRRSLENMNGTQSEYKIYLNDPVDLCETGGTGQIDLLGITRCDPNEYFIKFTSTKEGQIDLLLDFDGNDGVYTPGTADLIISQTVTTDQVGIPACITWDGKDGLGNSIPEDTGTQIPVVLSYAQGIFHFPIYDAEFLTEGFQITAVRPSGPDPLLYYDDSNISVLSGSGEPQVQLAGCVLPCHRWNNYTTPDFVGFGNLNTINSWWFSQQLTTAELLFLPAYYECNIEGPDRICEGETGQLILTPALLPSGASNTLDIIGINWTGPAISGPADNDTLTINGGGDYTATLEWTTMLGDTCETTCSYTVIEEPIITTQIDTFVNFGDTLTINGTEYTEETADTQYFVGQNGCDSLVIIDISVIQTNATALQYHLDDCNSLINSGDNADYSEFIPSYPTPLICGNVDATVIFRDNSIENIHSCTPGVNGTPAMCVGSNDDCTYDDGTDKAIVFEVTIEPDAGKTIAIGGLEFYEQAPETYDWIGGASGQNNYPTLYGVRVIKDGVEIFREIDLATTNDWTLESFDFMNNSDFIVDQTTTFRFELMGYCTIGNGATVNAWDVDEFTLLASCLASRPYIGGKLVRTNGDPLDAVEVQISTDRYFSSFREGFTNELGEYNFTHNHSGTSYFVRAEDDNDLLEDVTTLDILHLRGHLTGRLPFNTPYQLIAADINNTRSVSTMDIIALRQMILGVTEELENNTSWRFGAISHSISFEDPWSLLETLSAKNVYQDVTDLNFVGIKVGDVSGTARPTAANNATVRDNRPLKLEYDQIFGVDGSIQINFKADDNRVLSGLQVAISIDEAMIFEVLPGTIGELYHFIPDQDLSTARIIWEKPEGIQPKKDDILFSIVLNSAQSLKTIPGIHIVQDRLKATAYTGSEWLATDIQLASTDESGQMVLYQNRPNPFLDNTTIDFELTKESTVILEIRDVNGRTVYYLESIFSAGYHQVSIDRDDLSDSSSILFYTLRTGDRSMTRRMSLLR